MALEAHFEQTIRSGIELGGVGLHSGAPVSMRLIPAPAGSGIVFRRTDLDNFEIAAVGRNVAKVAREFGELRDGGILDMQAGSAAGGKLEAGGSADAA